MSRYPGFLCLLTSFLFCGVGLTGCLEISPQQSLVGVSLGSRSRHHQQMLKEMEREADNENSVRLDARIADGDVERQLADIREMGEADVDLLIVCAIDPVAIAPAVQEVFDRGIPVLLVDNVLSNECYTAFIGTEFYDMGRSMGEYLMQKLVSRGNIVIINLDNQKQAPAAFVAGLENTVRSRPDIRVVAELKARDKESAALQIADVLETRQPINYILTETYDLGQGAWEAMSNSGAARIPIIVGDLEGFGSEAVDALGKEQITAVIESVTSGECVMRLAQSILEGTHFARFNYSSVNVIDEDNLDLLNAVRTELESERSHSDKVNLRYDGLRGSIQRHSYVNILIAVLFFVLLLSVWMLIRYLNQRKKNMDRLSIDKSHIENERSKLRKQNREQSVTIEQGRRFVSAVAHDLRAPLTLILDPVRQLLNSRELSSDDRRLVELMAPNVRMQYRLVRQLNDIMNYKQGYESPVFREFDFSHEIKSWLDQFRNQAVRKHLNFSAVIEEGDYRMIGDREKIVRIVYDLLGYSYKYTPVNGSVRFHACVEGRGDKRCLCITVSDTGMGIPKKVKRFFFNSYMLDSDTAGASTMGLVLAKVFTELHKGDISASDNPVGRGTVVKLKLPMTQPLSADRNIYLEEEDRLTREMMSAIPDITSLETPTIHHDVIVNVDEQIGNEVPKEGESCKPHILIVANNHTMRQYLRQLLSDGFSILGATNGQEALQIAIRQMPSLVITDGMMPVMNGWELCEKLRADRQTAHIPVIMITAYSEQDRMEKAYEAGVDTYITKPFSADLIKAAVVGLLNNRRLVRESCNDTPALDKKVRQDYSQTEKTWVEKLYAYVQEHLADQDISVEEMGRQFGLGRVQFYRRCKQLTNLPPNELIRTIRLKRAFTLLSTTDMSISEVAYAVGFSSPSYFSRCYRDYFGQTPKERINETK